MRLFMVLLVGVFLCLAVSIVPAQATPYNLIIDEYGPGYYQDMDPSSDGLWHVWNGALQTDPIEGGNSLIYIGTRYSPFTGYQDVVVNDPSGAISDVLRFWGPTSTSTNIYVILYSAVGGGAPADRGIPTDLIVVDTVNENPDGTFYWLNPVNGSQYFGYSDTVAPNPIPEPTTMLLLGSGLIGLAGYGRKKFFKK
jgi:hypothetical protein